MPDYLNTGVNTVKDVLQYFTERSRSSDRIKNDLLRELRDNIKLLEHRNREGVDQKALILKLSVHAIGQAYAGNYKFEKLCDGPKTLPAALARTKQQQKYIGWTAEQFLYNIEGKVNDLHNLPNLYPDLSKAPIHLHVRLDNLYELLVLFGIFISRKSR